MATVTDPTAAERINGADEPGYLDLLGYVGYHEAITLTAAVADTHPDDVLRPATLQQHLAALAGRRAPWVPDYQTVQRYCRDALVRGGVVDPTQVPARVMKRTVRAYLPRLDGQEQRHRLYVALMGWGLRHPQSSTQLLLGKPCGSPTSPGRPAGLRVAIYRQLLRTPERVVPYQDLIAAVATGPHQQARFRQAVSVLSVAKVLAKRRLDAHRGGVGIAPAWRPAIADLVTTVDALAEPDTDPPDSTILGRLLDDPDCVAELLGKAAAHSPIVVGYATGSAVTAAEVHNIVAASSHPVTVNEVCQHLHGRGRPIGRLHVLAYLNQGLDAGTLRLSDADVPDQSPIPPWVAPYRFTTAEPAKETTQ